MLAAAPMQAERPQLLTSSDVISVLASLPKYASSSARPTYSGTSRPQHTSKAVSGRSSVTALCLPGWIRLAHAELRLPHSCRVAIGLIHVHGIGGSSLPPGLQQHYCPSQA